MCRLYKALYGHPEAGGHWERLLTESVLALGAVPVPEHKSTYWFAAAEQLLTVYVDDLLLSGPAHKQKQIWGLIQSKINIGGIEVTDRYLGRTHKLSPLPKPKT